MLSLINRVINRPKTLTERTVAKAQQVLAGQRGGLTNILALVGTILVLALNSILILQTFGVPIPGLSDAG
ncbi:MAG: hypothetical protein ABSA62_05495 [Methyloceanibacter sp.]|jgi:hypothetical protein